MITTIADRIQGVIPTTSVSKPQLKSTRMRDKVMQNNSQVKKKEVEDHRRNFKFSNNKTSVTACNDSLNAKTSNVNFVYVNCGKCVLNENHDSTTNILEPTSVRGSNLSYTPLSSNSFVARRNYLIYRRLWLHKAHDGKSQALTNFGNVTIKWVYYVERLNCSLYSVGKFCDADLEVDFWKSSCHIRDLKGSDLPTSSRGRDLYSITLQETTSHNLICPLGWHLEEIHVTLAHLEKEHTKLVYLRNKEDKRRGVDYVMSKILGFYKECLELGPEYVTGLKDEGEVTLYLTRRSLEVLRKFYWTTLGGRFNQLSHVSSLLLSKPGEY
ncbi:hypothetical protein Tco_1041868 [Tanacetum coccineum]|uniref:Uncharacterized protein n=1 Tax=Tanacetum coccineum TaxID=301880 RepID=A0ABQ5GK41_9ASTR